MIPAVSFSDPLFWTMTKFGLSTQQVLAFTAYVCVVLVLVVAVRAIRGRR